MPSSAGRGVYSLVRARVLRSNSHTDDGAVTGSTATVHLSLSVVVDVTLMSPLSVVSRKAMSRPTAASSGFHSVRK